MINIIFIVLFL